MKMSVIICAHNPQENYLIRVLEALQQQTLPKDQWEFLLINNASAEPLTGRFDLSWHPHGRHVLETGLGLTQARLRGIKEAKTELIVFVDDDNVLKSDYLAQCVRIRAEKPWVGVFGGSISAEYENDPGEWFRPYEETIAVRKAVREFWSNDNKVASYGPIGAGMVVRKEIADCYVVQVEGDATRKGLGRKGGSLMGGEDLDLVLVACEAGFGKGVFPELQLTHLIAARRTEPAYLWRLVEGSAQSFVLLHLLRGEKIDRPAKPTLLSRCNQWRFRRELEWHDRAYRDAWARGLAAGWAMWDRLQAEKAGS
jgi:GT2 family glycosyltransferase